VPHQNAHAADVSPQGPRSFETTRWSLVISAGQVGTPESQEALATLCNLYWYPTYLFVRRRGYGAEEGLDLTQGFFTRLLEKNDLATADRSRGRFRSWLLGCLKHFLSNEWDRTKALKRGGGKAILSINAEDAEGRYLREPSHDLTPERTFDRRWALTLLDQTLSTLKDECKKNGKQSLFEALKPALAGEGRDEGYADIGEQLGMSEGAVKVAAHRLRSRYRDILRARIGETVDTEAAVDEEIRDLFAALG
jgi:DNA-directed RNA polymerase specialized sigma24 family protein